MYQYGQFLKIAIVCLLGAMRMGWQAVNFIKYSYYPKKRIESLWFFALKEEL